MPIKHVLSDGTVLDDIKGHVVDGDDLKKEDDKPDQDVERQSNS